MIERTPDFTILSATLNSGSYLGSCVDSVRRQNFANWEHLIIDGGSADGSLEFLKNLSDERIKLHSGEDKGIADALNKGLERVKGEWILILQGDDMLSHHNILSDVHEKIIQDSEAIHAFAIELVGGYRSRLHRPDSLLRRFGLKPLPHQGLFVPRSVYERVGLFDLSLDITFDFDWTQRVRKAGLRVVFHKECVAKMSDEGVSSSQEWKLLRKRLFEEQRVRLRYSSFLMRAFNRVLFPPYLLYRFAICYFNR